MPRRSDPFLTVLSFFQTAPIDVCKVALTLAKRELAQREPPTPTRRVRKAAPTVETPAGPQVAPGRRRRRAVVLSPPAADPTPLSELPGPPPPTVGD